MVFFLKKKGFVFCKKLFFFFFEKKGCLKKRGGVLKGEGVFLKERRRERGVRGVGEGVFWRRLF